ncbi:NAD(P)H-dependent oxidoreductase [Pedobacter aquatilis]|uniref:FMN-dependent NADH-azoreductase n=1 Tax=Pedobacter aquatilis TaxID=351343 RepID=UPI0025B3D386|nr:NAD(P)H-dependent oxidoreductase [Pedobacter aquatilis]MDN3588463.1 NAD(P)H-dependent oxidoreductase [Pedobacter aquatilis]
MQVISSPNEEASFSTRLGNAVVEQIKAAHPGSAVQVRNLAQSPFPHLEEATLAAFYTPASEQTTATKAALQHSDEAIAELMEADMIVVSTPLWNFSIPSVLKAWIDHIVRAGVTFKYSEAGAEGLVTGKTVYIAIASGGVYSSGPYQIYDFVSTYLKSVLGFMGMTDLKIFRVEGVAYPGQAEAAMQKGLDSITL